MRFTRSKSQGYDRFLGASCDRRMGEERADLRLTFRSDDGGRSTIVIRIHPIQWESVRESIDRAVKLSEGAGKYGSAT